MFLYNIDVHKLNGGYWCFEYPFSYEYVGHSQNWAFTPDSATFVMRKNAWGMYENNAWIKKTRVEFKNMNICIRKFQNIVCTISASISADV